MEQTTPRPRHADPRRRLDPRRVDPRRLDLRAVGLWLAFVVPFVVALVALARPRFFPVLDLAQTELRIRDVASAHPPLVGLPGRIGPFLQGSHPGPLSFWVLWPVYWLTGSSAWSMTAAAAALNLAAIATALWLAKRRGGSVMAVVIAASLAALVRFYGPSLLTQPWNPYLPMLWFVVFVIAVWSVFDDDLVALPVAVFAGSLCVQTHISYAALVAGLGGLVGVVLVFRIVRERESESRRARIVRLLASLGFGLVLWCLPIFQQVTSDRGNLTIIWDHFTNPPEDPIGLDRGIRLLLEHLNPFALIVGEDRSYGTAGGAVVLVLWLASVVAAWTRRERTDAASLLRLDAVLGVAALLGVWSIARIFGFVWYYLMLWGWAIGVLMLVAIGWTGVLLFGARNDAAVVRGRRFAIGALVVLSGGLLADLTFDARNLEAPEAEIAEPLRTLVPDTIAAIDYARVPGADRDGKLLVTWTLTHRLGSLGYGLLSELEREGFDVGTIDVMRVVTTEHRVLDAGEATAEVHLAQGDEIEEWRSKPGFEEVAYIDLRSEADLARFARLRAEVLPILEQAGLDDVADLVDVNLFVATFDARNPPEAKRLLEEMLAIGYPAAVFIGPAPV